MFKFLTAFALPMIPLGDRNHFNATGPSTVK